MSLRSSPNCLIVKASGQSISPIIMSLWPMLMLSRAQINISRKLNHCQCSLYWSNLLSLAYPCHGSLLAIHQSYRAEAVRQFVSCPKCLSNFLWIAQDHSNCYAPGYICIIWSCLYQQISSCSIPWTTSEVVWIHRSLLLVFTTHYVHCSAASGPSICYAWCSLLNGFRNTSLKASGMDIHAQIQSL